MSEQTLQQKLDSWSGPEQHRQIAAAIPNSELVIVAGAGHMIQLEAPEAVNTAIARWLERPATDQPSTPTIPLGEVAIHE